MTRDNLCHAFMVIMGVGAVWLNVVEPINLGRLPQAAPSLSRQAAEPVSRLGPDGLQSTIAGDAQ